MSTLATILFVGGAISEFAGIVMIAFPDLLPGTRRLSAWLERRARIVANRIRRLLGLPPRRHEVAGSASLTGSGRVRGSGVVGIGLGATIEQKVDFLLRRDQASQEAVNRLARRMEDLEERLARDLEGLCEQMEGHVERKLTIAAEQYRALRVAGTAALAFGLVCVTTANFV